ncbi:MAG: MmgE/PrpD family protein, partial [bacterium]
HALGVVWTQAAGNRQGLVDGALTKRLQPAFYAQAATVAALLARRAITGASSAFDGPYGLFPLVVGSGWDPKPVTAGLGVTYVMQEIGIKPYPCCRLSHPAVEAVLHLVACHGIAADDVQSATVHLPDEATWRFVGQPLAIRGNPQVDAQFSVAYCVAAAILHRQLGLVQFRTEAILDRDVRNLAAKVKAVIDTGRPDSVSIRLLDGRVVSESVAQPLGHPARPLSRDAIARKLRDCCEQAANRPRDAQVDRLLALLDEFSSARDASELLKATCP